MESLGYRGHSSVVDNVQQWTSGVEKSKRRFHMAWRVLCFQSADHKCVWTVKFGEDGFMRTGAPFPANYNWSHCCLWMLSWYNIPAIWPLTLGSFNYLSVFCTRLSHCCCFYTFLFFCHYQPCRMFEEVKAKLEAFTVESYTLKQNKLLGIFQTDAPF